MGHRITYAIRKDGALSLYSSRWGALTAPADMFWGPDATADFIRSNPEAQGWYDDCWGEGAIGLDYDTNTVVFFGVYEYAPKVHRLYERMAGLVWGAQWTIRWVDDMPDVAAQVGVDEDVVRSPPIVGSLERLGQSFDAGHYRGLMTVVDADGSRDIVFDTEGICLLMNGPVVLEHLHEGKVWDEFLVFHATRERSLGDEERSVIMKRLDDFVLLDRVAQELVVHRTQHYDVGFLERTFAALWPAWQVRVVDGGVDEHFAHLGRELPAQLIERPLVFGSHDEPEPEPESFEACVAEIAGFLFGNEAIKEEMGAFTQRLRTQTEADAEGPVHWGEGFFDLIPASGPGGEDRKLRFEQIVRQLAREVQQAN